MKQVVLKLPSMEQCKDLFTLRSVSLHVLYSYTLPETDSDMDSDLDLKTNSYIVL